MGRIVITTIGGAAFLILTVCVYLFGWNPFESLFRVILDLVLVSPAIFLVALMGQKFHPRTELGDGKNYSNTLSPEPLLLPYLYQAEF